MLYLLHHRSDNQVLPLSRQPHVHVFFHSILNDTNTNHFFGIMVQLKIVSKIRYLLQIFQSGYSEDLILKFN